MKKIKTSISLDKDVYETVKRIGVQEDRSFSQQVNKVLRDFIKDRD